MKAENGATFKLQWNKVKAFDTMYVLLAYCNREKIIANTRAVFCEEDLSKLTFGQDRDQGLLIKHEGKWSIVRIENNLLDMMVESSNCSRILRNDVSEISVINCKTKVSKLYVE